MADAAAAVPDDGDAKEAGAGASSLLISCFDCLEEYNIDAADGLAGTTFDCTCGNVVEVPQEPWPEAEADPSAQNDDAEGGAEDEAEVTLEEDESAEEEELADAIVDEDPGPESPSAIADEVDGQAGDDSAASAGSSSGRWADGVGGGEEQGSARGYGPGVGASDLEEETEEASGQPGEREVIDLEPPGRVERSAAEDDVAADGAKSTFLGEGEDAGGSAGARLEFGDEESVAGDPPPGGGSFFSDAGDSDAGDSEAGDSEAKGSSAAEEVSSSKLNLSSDKVNLPSAKHPGTEEDQADAELGRQVLDASAPERELRDSEEEVDGPHEGTGPEEVARPDGGEADVTRGRRRPWVLAGLLVLAISGAVVDTFELWKTASDRKSAVDLAGSQTAEESEVAAPELKRGTFWSDERKDRLWAKLGFVRAAPAAEPEPYEYPEGISVLDKIDMMPYLELKALAQTLSSEQNRADYEWAHARLAVTFGDPQSAKIVRKWVPRGRPVSGGFARKAAFVMAMTLVGRHKSGSDWGAKEARKAQRTPGAAQLNYAVARAISDPFVAVEFANRAFSRNRYSVDAHLLRSRIFMDRRAPAATVQLLKLAEGARDPSIAIFAAEILMDGGKFAAAEGLLDAVDHEGLRQALAPAARDPMLRLVLTRRIVAGRLSEAEELARARVASAPESTAKVIDMARLQLAINKDGVGTLERALKLVKSPAQRAHLLSEKMRHFLARDDLGAARTTLGRIEALPKKPSKAWRHYARGLLREASGDAGKALKSFKKAGRKHALAALAAARLSGNTSTKQLAGLAKRHQHPAIDLAYARALRDDGDYQAAENVMGQVVWNYPTVGEPTALAVEWIELLAQGDEGERALALLHELQLARPKDPRIVQAIIRVGEIQSRPDIVAYWRQRLQGLESGANETGSGSDDG